MKIILFVGLCLFIGGCNTNNSLYYDLKQQAIVSCSGTFREVDIETPQSMVIIKGPINSKPFYIYKPNPDYSITIDGEDQFGHFPAMQSNTTYILRIDRGPDSGPGSLTLSTDSNGIIVSASKTQCN